MVDRRIVLLSGPIAAGKSTITKALTTHHEFACIRSGEYLLSIARRDRLLDSREGLQALGDKLDVETDFAWLVADVARPLIEAASAEQRWLLDSVRKARQIEHFRSCFSGVVVHVHVTAPEEELRRRYDERLYQGGEYLGGTPYDVAIAHPNEIAARALGSMAEIIVDTTRSDPIREIMAYISQ